MKTYTVTRGCTTAGQGNPVGWTRIVCNEEELKLIWPGEKEETFELVEKSAYDELERKIKEYGELIDKAWKLEADKLAEALERRHHVDGERLADQALREYRGKK